MAKGVSINIGLNEVDPDGYSGWNEKLKGCENDATAMHGIATWKGFKAELLLYKRATSANVLKEIALAARDLVSGDILLLTFAGHGGKICDVTSDEPDAQDEGWLLYDRFLLDDELCGLWAKFAPGVRIFVLSDSCNSGTVANLAINAEILNLTSLAKRLGLSEQIRFRCMPEDKAAVAYKQRKLLYDALQWTNLKGYKVDIRASLILISACQDNQLAADGKPNGYFTETMLKVWANGKFNGNYQIFCEQIVKQMPGTQTPNFFQLGVHNLNFEAQVPFTIA